MSLQDVEVAAVYGALDSDAFIDGGFKHSHGLRALTRGVNHLVLQGHPLLNLSWDEYDPGGEEIPLTMRGVGFLSWTKLIPGAFMRPKMHGLVHSDWVVFADIPTDHRVYLQIQTLRHGVDFALPYHHSRVLEMIGAGGIAEYNLTDLPINRTGMERFAFWLKGHVTDDEGDEAAHTNAGANAGQVTSLSPAGVLLSTTGGLLWNNGIGAHTWATDHVLVVHDGLSVGSIGNTIYEAQIVEVTGPSSMQLYPPPPSAIGARTLPAKYFQIYELPTIRLFHLSGCAQTRVV